MDQAPLVALCGVSSDELLLPGFHVFSIIYLSI